MGVYFYCYDTSPAAAAITAQQVIKMLSGHKFAYPIYYDVEYEGYNLNCGKAQNTAIIKAALDTLEAARYYAAVYCSRDFFINIIPHHELLGNYDFQMIDNTLRYIIPYQHNIRKIYHKFPRRSCNGLRVLL